jgi:hypothetical protein
VIGAWSEVPVQFDRLTTDERLSDIVEILAHGLLWLDAFSVDFPDSLWHLNAYSLRQQ